MRTINCKLDVLTRTDSSVLFSQGIAAKIVRLSADEMVFR